MPSTRARRRDTSGVARASEVVRGMTVQVMKTKAEAALSEHFADVADKLPGGAAARRARAEAIGQFAAQGLPHRRIEQWKYTDLRTLLKEAYRPQADGRASEDAIVRASRRALPGIEADVTVFVDGVLARGKADGGKLEVSSVAAELSKGREMLTPDLPDTVDAGARSVLALNTAFVTDGAVVRIPDRAVIERPLHLLFFATGAEPRAIATRNLVHVGKGAELTLIEQHVGDAGAARQENAVTELTLGEGARVIHVKCLEAGAGSAHFGNLIVRIGAGASYRPFQMTIGSGLVRNQIVATFAGEGGTFDFGVAFLIGGHAHADTTLLVDHAVPGCTSRELVKGVLGGAARGIFQGKVVVRPGAQKSDGKQMAQALMLSPDAEFDSKPELEIHADDVICGHGSTAAEIDGDLLFYCRTRGMSLAEARAMLVESFIGEVIEKVAHEGVRQALAGRARAWLAASQAEDAADKG